MEILEIKNVKNKTFQKSMMGSTSEGRKQREKMVTCKREQ